MKRILEDLEIVFVESESKKMEEMEKWVEMEEEIWKIIEGKDKEIVKEIKVCKEVEWKV